MPLPNKSLRAADDLSDRGGLGGVDGLERAALRVSENRC
jgi:hypothetical protein